MRDKKVIAKEIISEIEGLIKYGVENGEVAEGWLTDWDDVEYRISKVSEYRGVAMFQENYRNGYDIEIETTRPHILVLDTRTEEILAMKYFTDEKTLDALREIDYAWEDDYYTV